MAVANLILSPLALVYVFLALLAYPLYRYFVTYGHLRGVPAPFPAQFSDLWLLSAARRGKRYAIVDKVHKKLGPVVRIQPNHISLNDDEAIQIVLGHGNGYLKSSFFSAKSVHEFEPYIHSNLSLFVKQWDELTQCSRLSDGFAQFDCLKWFNYLAFDIIGDLAFGAPFGMLSAGADVAEMRASPTSAPVFAPAIEVLNRRGEVSATLGCLPQLKPYAKWLPDPFFSRGLKAVENLAGIAIARVKARLDRPPPASRKDLLSRLQEGRDESGLPMGREELTAEALTQLIAGSDTTSNTSCALLFHIARTPGVLAKLQAELDLAIAADVDVPSYDMVKDLPYLEAVVHEGLRHHSTSGIGLPRQIPDDSPGLHFRGYYFPPGTVLSVPTYSIHHSTEIWGPDADQFRPERWETLTPRQKNAFIPFSYGPRACVGRNVAEMELKLIVATWARRYDVVLRQEHMDIREGFLRKPLGLEIGLKRRQSPYAS